jgi:histidine triad (HIT) family protein
MSDCIFCKIVAGEAHADIVYQDKLCIGFRDLHPIAPVHVLVIPRVHIPTLNDLGPEHAELISALFSAIKTIAHKMGVSEKGYRVLANCNKGAGQQVFHVHFHVIAGPLDFSRVKRVYSAD